MRPHHGGSPAPAGRRTGRWPRVGAQRAVGVAVARRSGDTRTASGGTSAAGINARSKNGTPTPALECVLIPRARPPRRTPPPVGGVHAANDKCRGVCRRRTPRKSRHLDLGPCSTSPGRGRREGCARTAVLLGRAGHRSARGGGGSFRPQRLALPLPGAAALAAGRHPTCVTPERRAPAMPPRGSAQTQRARPAPASSRRCPVVPVLAQIF